MSSVPSYQSSPSVESAPPSIGLGVLVAAAVAATSEKLVGSTVTDLASRAVGLGNRLWGGLKRAVSTAMSETAAGCSNLISRAEQLPESTGLRGAAYKTARAVAKVARVSGSALKATGSFAGRAVVSTGSAALNVTSKATRKLMPKKITNAYDSTAKAIRDASGAIREVTSILNDPATTRMELSPPPFAAAAAVATEVLEREQRLLWDSVAVQGSQFAALFAGARAAAGEALDTQDVWDCFKAAAGGYCNWNGWRLRQQQLAGAQQEQPIPVVENWMTLSQSERLAQISSRCRAFMGQMLKEKYQVSWWKRHAAHAAFDTTSGYMNRLLARFADKLLPALQHLHSAEGTAQAVSKIQELVHLLALKMGSYHSVTDQLAAGEQLIDEVTGAILQGNVQEVLAQALSSSRFNGGISAAERERLMREYLVDQWIPDPLSASSWFSDRLNPHFHGPWWQQLGQALVYILSAPFLALGWVVSKTVEMVVNPILKRKINETIHDTRAIPQAIQIVRNKLVSATEAQAPGDATSRMTLAMKQVMTTALRKGAWKIYRFIEEGLRNNDPSHLRAMSVERRRQKASSLSPQAREHARQLVAGLLGTLKVQNAMTPEALREARSEPEHAEELGGVAQFVREYFGISADELIEKRLVEHSGDILEIVVDCLLEDRSYLLTAVNESLRAAADVFNPDAPEPSVDDAARVETSFQEALSELQKQLGCLVAHKALENPALEQRRELLGLQEFFAQGVQGIRDPIGDIRTLFGEAPADSLEELSAHIGKWQADHSALNLTALREQIVDGLREELPGDAESPEALAEHFDLLSRGIDRVGALSQLSRDAARMERGIAQMGVVSRDLQADLDRLGHILAQDGSEQEPFRAEDNRLLAAHGREATDQADQLLRELTTLSSDGARLAAAGVDVTGLAQARTELEAAILQMRQAQSSLVPLESYKLEQRQQLEDFTSALYTLHLVQGAADQERTQRQLQLNRIGSALRLLPIPMGLITQLRALSEWNELVGCPARDDEAQNALERLEALTSTPLWREQIAQLPGITEGLAEIASHRDAVRVPSVEAAQEHLRALVQGYTLPRIGFWNGGAPRELINRFQNLQGELHAKLLIGRPIGEEEIEAFRNMRLDLPLEERNRQHLADVHASRVRMAGQLQQLRASVVAAQQALEAAGPYGTGTLGTQLEARLSSEVQLLQEEQQRLEGCIAGLPTPSAHRYEREGFKIKGWKLPARLFFEHLARQLAPAEVQDRDEQNRLLHRRLTGVIAATVSNLADRKIRPLLAVAHNGAVLSAAIDTGMTMLASYQAQRTGQTPQPAAFAAQALHAIAPAGRA